MVRGGGSKACEKHNGEEKQVTTLSPFGKPWALGLRRRPVFASSNTVKVVAKNVWAWGHKEGETKLQSHRLLYTGFKRGMCKDSSFTSKFATKAAEMSTNRVQDQLSA